MIKNYSLFILLTISIVCNAQLNLTWNNRIGGRLTSEKVTDFAYDKNGNIIAIGFYNQSTFFNSDTTVKDSLPMIGTGTDAFIAKYSVAGKLKWVKTIGGVGITTEDFKKINIDKDGNILIAGAFNKTLDFDPSANSTNVTVKSDNDGFVAKYDSVGNFMWVRTFAGNTNDEANDVCSDANGNVYAVGSYFGQMTLKKTATDSLNFTGNGGGEILLLKYSPAGKLLWAESVGGIGPDVGMFIKYDNANGLYVSGTFQSTVDFDPDTSTFVLSAIVSSYSNPFVAKYDTAGKFIMANKIGSNTYSDKLNAFALDTKGNYYLSGTFQGTMDLDPSSSVYNLTSQGTLNDVYLAKYASDGQFIWANRIGGVSNEYINSICTDNNNYVYITGKFTGVSAIFGTDTGATKYSSYAGSYDAYLAVYNEKGSGVFDGIIGASGDDEGVVIGSFENRINVAGNFTGANVDLDFSKNVYSINSSYTINPKDTNKIKNFTKDVFFSNYINCLINKTITEKNGTLSTTNVGTSQWLSYKNGKYTSVSGATSNTYKPTQAGAYAVAVSNGICKDTTSLFTVSECDVTDNTVSQLVNGTLSSTKAGLSYQWVNCDLKMVSINGQINKTFTPTKQGSYAIVVELDGCLDTSSCFSTTVGINDVTNSYALKVYPNPIKDIVIVNANNIINASIKFIDVLGNTVQILENNITTQTLNKEYDISNLNYGIYFFEIRSENGNSIIKLIKE